MKNPNAEVVAICGRDESRIKAKMAEVGLEKCAIYTDYEKMLKRDDIDIISICTPNDQHVKEAWRPVIETLMESLIVIETEILA